MDEPKNCKNCANAIFDPVWGECKCSVSQLRIYNVSAHVDCEHHKKKDAGGSVSLTNKGGKN